MCFILQLDTLGNLHPMIYTSEYNKLSGCSFIFFPPSILTFALCKSWAPPIWASMRWSQWMVEGTATLGRPLLMNWSIAIWAVASCMATRSGRRRRYVRPRSISCPAGSSRWPYTIFSDRVRGLPSLVVWINTTVGLHFLKSSIK